MTFRLHLLSLKKVYMILAIGIPLIIFAGILPAIYLVNSIAYLPVIIVLFAAVVISMHIFSREVHDIMLNEDGMIFNGQSISHVDILGHYLNTDAIGMTLFDIRLKNGKKVRMCCSNYGKNKANFDEFVITATRMIDASRQDYHQ